MLFFSLLFFYSIILTYLAWRKFNQAVGLLIITLPAYLIRFNIGPLPSTVLELNFVLIFLVWLVKYARLDWPELKRSLAANRWLYFFILLFFLASLAGIFISDQWYISLGQWRAYFLEPLIFFLIIVGRKQTISPDYVIWSLAFSTISISTVAIIQKLTGQFYPPSLWDDQLFGRATAFFTSPNAVGLYLAPITILLLGLALQNRSSKKLFSLLSFIIIIALLALASSFSVGAILALGIGFLIFIFLLGHKRPVAIIAIIAGILIATAFPLLSQQKSQSANNRLTIWKYSQEFLTASPSNFIFGAGIRQFFRKVQKPHYNTKELERLIYPHNIFLNFWSEIGLVGLISFTAIFYLLSFTAFKIYQTKNKILGAALFCSLIIFFLHGLVDVPYFKNDLAFLFWTIAAAVHTSGTKPASNS